MMLELILLSAVLLGALFIGARAGGVEHDDMNVLVMGGRVIDESVALELVCAFLNSRYTGEDRHERRLAKAKAMERRFTRQT